MEFKLSSRSLKNVTGVHPDLIRVINLALQISKIDFGIPETGGIRNADEQNILFLEGKSKCNGYDNRSAHQDGNAFDYFAYEHGRLSYKDKDMAMVATAILQAASQLGVSVEWSGLWTGFHELCHIQLLNPPGFRTV